jgi:hypothetical protein
MATGQSSDNQSGARQGSANQGDEWGVGQLTDAAMEQGRNLLDSAKEQASGFVDQRKNDAAQSVVGLANSLRESGRAFEDLPQVRTLVDTAAGGIEQFADTIRERSVNDMLNDVEDIVRRRPMTVAVATLAAGFLLARFIKASAENARDMGRTANGGGRSRRQSQA